MTREITDPDAQIILEIQHGSRDAFNQLVRRHQAAVRRLAQRLIDDEEEARDVAQEVFVLAWRELPRWRFKAKFFTWLYQTTWNLSRGVRRKAYRHQYREKPPQPDSAPSGNRREEIITAERHVAVRAAVAALPERQRQVVILRVDEKLSVAQTADVMKCKEGTVKALLFQALKKLSGLLQTENDYER